MKEEELRKLAQEEIQKQIMENLDSSIIFTYVNNLENNLRDNYIPKDQIKAKIEELHCDEDNLEDCIRRDTLKELLEE